MTAPSRALKPAALALVFAVSVAMFWSGIGPGDAERYLEAALRWQEGPWLGDTHWALRHLFVLPMAASFSLFGTGELAAALPNFVYAAMTVALTWTFGRRFLGEREAFIAGALIAASAFFVARPLEVEVYGAEAFFAALSCWLFIAARDNRRRWILLTAAGLCAGLAWSVREQAIYLLAVFGAVSLMERRQVVLSAAFVAAGFAAVIAAELLLYAAVADDPLYRYRVDLGHRDVGVTAQMTADEAALPARAARLFRYLATTPGTTPMLLMAAASLAYLRRTDAFGDGARRRVLSVFAVVAVISPLGASLVFNISATRYYPLLTYAAFLIVAVAIARAAATGRRRAAVAAAVTVVAVNIAAVDFSRDNEYDEARGLARLAATSSEPLYADPVSVNAARYQLRLRGWSAEDASDRVRIARYADKGALVFRTARLPAPASPVCILSKERLRSTGWTHWLLRKTGVARLFGARARAITAEPAPVTVYRLLDAPALADPVSGRRCLQAAG